MSGKLYIAAAGSGKTKKIIEESLDTDKKVLIVTYTITNEKHIIDRIKNEVGIIPNNITISTWFSFLLKDGIRPYQGIKFKERIEGILFVNGQNNTNVKKSSNEYYIKNNKIYTNKISECVIDLNDKCDGKVFERISKIYDCVYVDEVQDLVGYDLEILKCLIATRIKVIMVGDPRQCTYSTHSSRKYKKYNNGKIDEFLKKECKKLDVTIDDTTLNSNYRNNKIICEFANSLYPDRKPPTAHCNAKDKLDGIKIIDKSNIDKYLKEYNAVQLRENKTIIVNEEYPYYNFGESKGMEFSRVLIYPTTPIWNWIINSSEEKLKNKSRAKFYVAVTRAKDSVVIVRKDSQNCRFEEIKF